MFHKNRKFKNEDYLKFIRSLPCCVRHSKDCIDAHHTDVKGMGGGFVNDFTAVPLERFLHTGQFSHISYEKLRSLIKEDPKELIIFYLSLYAEYLQGKYDLEADSYVNFIELKRKRMGLND